jgi:hypothetical protein
MKEPRPDIIDGHIQKVKVGCGTLFIPVGMEKGKITEIFLNGSKLGGCYDEDTDVLTDNGWKKFKEINQIADRVATLNLKTDELEYQLPLAYQHYYYEGVMYEITGKGVNLLVTPDHQLLYRRNTKSKKQKEFRLQGIKEVYLKERVLNYPSIELKKNCIWNNIVDNDVFVLPAYKTSVLSSKNRVFFRTKKERVFNMSDWLTFLGYYLSEGCTKDGDVSIFQHVESPTFNKIKDVVGRLGLNYNISIRKDRNNNARIRFFDVQISSYLSQLGKSEDKFVPREFLNLNREYLEILMRSLMEGDGSLNNGKFRRYSTISQRLANDVSEILVKLGYGVSISKVKQRDTIVDGRNIHRHPFGYEVYVSQTNLTPEISSKQIRRVDYKGFVYCCTVPNSTLLVRRKGKIVWCGNCRANQEGIGRLLSLAFRHDIPIEEIIDQLQLIICPACTRAKAKLADPDKIKVFPTSCPDAVAKFLQTIVDTNKKETKKEA